MLQWTDVVGTRLRIHELREDGMRLCHRFFTASDDCLIKHEFNLKDTGNSEVMVVESEAIGWAAYQELSMMATTEKLTVIAYENDPIMRVVASVEHVFMKDRVFDDLGRLEFLLASGLHIAFASDSPPPFVELMTVSELSSR